MNAQEKEQLDIGKIIAAILTTTVIVVLPGIAWELFGWLHILLPLLSFAVLLKFGTYTGKKFLLTASVLSLIFYIIIGNLDLFVFSAIFLLAGYVQFSSFEKKERPAISGLKTFATISSGWLAVLLLFTLGKEVSPYSQLISTLDLGISEALSFYQGSDSVTPETLAMLETTLSQMKLVLPLIMPAILGSIVLLITWFSMVLGNLIAIRQQGPTAWAGYGLWQLPDKLIWLAIVLGICVMLPIPGLRIFALNTLILLGLIYCFQGLAVAVFYMNKWNVPLLLRSFFYVMLIVQTFGTIVLLIVGIADVWLDLRKIKLSDNVKEDN